ncbi:MAG: outer-membrane lipoprotein carrier protein LolA [Thermodesulfovibrionales bacterium]|nr:outer-membrane lipoprotein carrier protein LolA [Thermodesulfovibrionales bacterium]
MKIIITTVLLSFLVIVLLSVPINAIDVDEEIARIQRAYENLKDLQGNFIQKSFIKDLKKIDTYKGKFYIKPPKLRWDYQTKSPQSVYFTEDKLIIYQKIERQVYISKLDSLSYGQFPIALLRGFGDIRRDFFISTKDGRLILKPKKSIGNISQIEILSFDDEFPIKAIKIADDLSNYTSIELKDIKLNSGIKDSFFDFTPPDNVSIIKQ